MKNLNLLVEFEPGEHVYLKTDDKQDLYIVVGYVIILNSVVKYLCKSNGDQLECYSIELSKEKVLSI